MNTETYNTTILYHCSHSADLADEPLKPFDGSASSIRGLCFSEGAEDQFGPYTYRASLKGDFLTTSLTWNLMLADDEGMEQIGRDGEPIHLTMDQLKEACKEAMAEMGMRLEEDVIDFVFERAIENDHCIEFNLDEYGNPEPWDSTIDGWDLQSVRALVAHKVGLEGATITDETGGAYIIANPDLILEQVEWNGEDFVVVSESADNVQGVQAVRQDEFYQSM